MIEDFIQYAASLNSTTILIFLFVIAFLENVFPPIPGDVPVVFAGYLISQGEHPFAWCVASATLGSLLGFMVVYFIGFTIGASLYGDSVQETKLSKYIHRIFPPDQMIAFREKFAQHSYWLVLINRFLSGTRTLISISAGLMHLNWFLVMIIAFFGSLAWNVVLVGGGYLLGDNWQELGRMLSTYGVILTIIIMLVLGFFINRFMDNHSKASN